MENKKKKKNLFANRKNRYLFLLLCVLPLLIVIGVFGFLAYKDVKSLINLAGDGIEVKNENVVGNNVYVLRDNATDLQKEYFKELKAMFEDGGEHTDEEYVTAVAKNYVADFYTWSNKLGQYDVGGMYYINDVDDFRLNVYTNARDSFYKYINEYMNTYGVENLLEVENAEVTNIKKMEDDYVLLHTYIVRGEVDDTYETVEYRYSDVYDATVNWTYVSEEKTFSTRNYPTSMHLLIVNDTYQGKWDIVEAGEKAFNFETVLDTADEVANEE